MSKEKNLPDIILLDVNPEMTDSWKKYFGSTTVNVVTSDLKEFIKNNGSTFDAMVSPGNSFGLMDGGYDKAIIEVFGQELQMRVREKIGKEYYGEQPVGTALSVGIPNTSNLLIHVPTMRTPGKIKDEMVVYHCMRSALIEARKSDVKTLLVPAFGGLTSQLPPETVSRMMWGAFVQFSVSYQASTWEEVIDYTDERLWRNYFKAELEAYKETKEDCHGN